MNTTLLLVGIACVVAAVVGGGLKLAGAEFPLLTSVPRQVLLAVVGLAVLLISFAGADDDDQDPGADGSAMSATTTSSTPSPGSTRPAPTTAPTSIPFPGGEVDLTLSRTSGPPGTDVEVSGTGFAGGETVDVRFHTTTVGRETADASGAFSVAVKVPPTPFRDQQFDFVATGRRSIRSARAPFEVT